MYMYVEGRAAHKKHMRYSCIQLEVSHNCNIYGCDLKSALYSVIRTEQLVVLVSTCKFHLLSSE